MKKMIPLLLALLLAAGLLTGCGEAAPAATEAPNALRAAAGTYQGLYTKLVGDETQEEEAFHLDLKADGTGTHYRNDLEIPVTWTLESEAVTMQETFLGLTMDYTGTLQGGKLNLFNGDPADDWTCEYVYQKQN